MAWYKCKVVFAEKTDENGERKQDVKEQYAVEAYSVTEAAAIIQEHLDGFNVSLDEVTKMQVKEFLNGREVGLESVSVPVYIAKVAFKTLDENTGVERKQNFRYMIEADTFEGAYLLVSAQKRGVISSDGEIISIGLSPIVEVIEDKKEKAQ